MLSTESKLKNNRFLLLIIFIPSCIENLQLKRNYNHNNDENFFDGYRIAILLLIANFILIF